MVLFIANVTTVLLGPGLLRVSAVVLTLLAVLAQLLSLPRRREQVAVRRQQLAEVQREYDEVFARLAEWEQEAMAEEQQ